MNIIKNFKAKFFSKRQGDIVDSLVFHSTEIPFKESLQMLCGGTDREVSSHFLINLDGAIYQFVDTDDMAWHAGKSFWRGREGINQYSIGFELVDVDDNNQTVDFTAKQMNSLVLLCKKIMAEYNIDQRNIVAHSDIAPDRKKDPGEKFDWKFMSRKGISLYHDVQIQGRLSKVKSKIGEHNSNVYLAKKLLKEIGYKIDLNDIHDIDFSSVLIAFKRRFFQNKVDDVLDDLTIEIINSVAKKFI